MGVSQLLTSNYILSETYTLIRMRLGLHAVRRFAGLLDGTSNVHVLWVDSGHHDAALHLLMRRPDKRWSHTDCTSFVLMEEFGISEAFAFDRNFEQAGFARCP